MRILFLEAYKRSPIPVQISLPFAYLTLATYVSNRSDKFAFHFYSYQLERLSNEASKSVADLMRHYQPDVVLVSAYTSTFDRSVALLALAKQFNVTTVIGGIFADSNSEFILTHYPEVDVVVRGEGELTLLQLLNTLYYQRPLYDVPNISFRDNEQIISNGKQTNRIKAIDIPLIDLSLIPIDKYKQLLARHYIFASRGCQYGCGFCTVNSIWNYSVTLRNVEDVKQDLLETVNTFGYKPSSLADSNITTHKNYYPRLLSSLREVAPEISFAVKGRIDELNHSYLDQLKSSGINHLGIGVETPIASQLEKLLKTKRPDTWARSILDMFDYAHSIGIHINFNFILGTPDESQHTLDYKVGFAERLYNLFGSRPYLSFLTPHPGTPTALALAANGLKIIDRDLEHYDHLHPIVIPIHEPDSFVDRLIDAYNEVSLRTDSEQVNPASLRASDVGNTHFPIYAYNSQWRSLVDMRNIWAVIEDVKGTTYHSEFDIESEIFKVQKTFKIPFPFHYGFLPGIRSGDGEELDIAIYSHQAAMTGQLRRVRLIGMALMKDGDTKVFGVFPDEDKYFSITEFGHLPEEVRKSTLAIFERHGPRINEFVDSIHTYQYVLSHRIMSNTDFTGA